MNILIAHSRYRSGDESGENRVVADEARLLAEAGHEVSVFTPSVDEGTPAVAAGMGSVWSRSQAKRLRYLIRRVRPQVVHFHNLFPALSPAAIRAAHGEGIAIVMTLHNFRLLCLPATLLRDGRVCEDCVGRIPWRGVVRGCYHGSTVASVPYAASLSLHRRLGTFELIQRFIAPSSFVRELHVKAGLPADRILVKPNFAWPSQRRREPGRHFLFLGRLSPEKGLRTLLQAWRPEFGRLLIAGKGPEARLLTSLPEGAAALGGIPASHVPQLLANARAVLVPSLCYEGFPRVIVEAYAQGVPVVASRIGALPEVVEHATTGLLFHPNDSAALAESLNLLTDDTVVTSLGRGAYQRWTERYTPEKNLLQLEAVYGVSFS